MSFEDSLVEGGGFGGRLCLQVLLEEAGEFAILPDGPCPVSPFGPAPHQPPLGAFIIGLQARCP